MFFDDVPLAPRKGATLRVAPPIPKTGWLPPQEFPNLSGARMISADVETHERDFDHGPGWGRGVDKGHIVGFSIGAVDSENNYGKWYFPLRHTIEANLNLPVENTLRWARDILQTPHIPKVFANGIYDLGWLTTEDIYVEGELHDVQFAEALLHESGDVALEFLGRKYVQRGKQSEQLYRWLAEAYGGSANDKQRSNIYRAPVTMVGPYGEDDADLPLRVLARQRPLLAVEGLDAVYRMECDLMRLLVRMRLRGVRVDVERAERHYGELGADIRALYVKLGQDFGYSIESVNSGEQLGKLFDSAGVRYPVTRHTGKPSFTKDWLKNLDHPLGVAINDIREREKLHGTFLYAYILNRHTNGRVHCTFDPLRDEDGGTRSGRFSSSDPNLQNIPARSKLGKQIREIFVPDIGHIALERNDYSQIEYRLLAHFAVGPGSERVRAAYNDDPRTDYHEYVQADVKEKTGQLIERKPIKNINFGLLYGMGIPKLARMLGISLALAKTILKAYHEGAPYVRATMDAAAEEAQRTGEVRTLLNRRSQFNLWEPIDIDYDNRAFALPKEQAIQVYGTMIQRAHTHKAINRRLQGSAADIFKKALLDCLNAGVFEYTGIPLLLVHDEDVFSVEDDSPQRNAAFAEMRRILAESTKLRVPVIVSTGRGVNWGACD